MSDLAILRIRRAAPGEAPRYEDHVVPFEHGQSLLDGLRHIRAQADSGLAFRYSCINANACKQCMMKVDGKSVYACMARLEARVMVVEPLPNKELIRDLLTDVAPSDERLGVDEPR